MGYAIGRYVVCRGQGLTRVQRVERDGTIVLQLSVDDADTLEVGKGEIDKRLRAPVEKSAGDKLVALLTKREGKPDPRPWGGQYLDIQKVLRKGDAKPLAERLHLLLRHPSPLPNAMERAIFAVEDSLLPELAHALAMPVNRLVTRIHNGQPAFSYQDETTNIQTMAGVLPDKLPKGWSHLGNFHLRSGRMVAGEISESDSEATFAGRSMKLSLTLKAKKGPWHAVKPSGSDWAGVFLHRDAAGSADKHLKAARELGKVSLERGAFCVLDAELREDRAFKRAGRFDVNQSVEGRGFVVEASEGECPVRVVYEGTEALLLAVPLE